LTGRLPLVTGPELSELLPMKAAIDAMESVFASHDKPEAPLRSRIETGSGDLLLMPAFGEYGAGVKLVTVAPANPQHGLPVLHALYALFAPGTLEPLALFDGSALTAVRTAAVSGLATRYLSRPDPRTLAIFGAGVQAWAHLVAMHTERPIERTWVVSRTEDRARSFVTRAADGGISAELGVSDVVAEADLICTCTTSTEPLFDGALLKPGVHVNAIGAYRPTDRELDTETMRRARIVVETREVALAEAGDLVIPIQEGAISEADLVADLGEVVGGKEVRTGPGVITVFKSVGVAFEDLALARAAYERMDR
jgi:ornithine cyclodeaminase/alanine dehydrogenase-like protein (mu-crystallin family)